MLPVAVAPFVNSRVLYAHERLGRQFARLPADAKAVYGVFSVHVGTAQSRGAGLRVGTRCSDPALATKLEGLLRAHYTEATTPLPPRPDPPATIEGAEATREAARGLLNRHVLHKATRGILQVHRAMREEPG